MLESRLTEDLNILLWRTWGPLYNHPATFSALEKHSIGGTCYQLLWHAKNLEQMGHHVQVLGATKEDIVEDQVEFIGSLNRTDQERLMKSGRVQRPDVIFLEGAFSAAELFKSLFPETKVIHIGQNIDRYGSRKAFEMERAIDVYAFVSPGNLADYCVRYRQLRHKFMLIRNVVPWEWLYSQVDPKPVEDKIAWVGAWTKKGLRQWAETMQRVLLEYPSYRWALYGPIHGAHVGGMPPYIFANLKFPEGRVAVSSLPLVTLIQEISSARVVLVSLGHETACISALDAHAMGRPVLSGNDMVFKYNNPEGSGIRVFTGRQRYDALVKLINDPGLCDSLGALGKEIILSDYTEINQRNDLGRVLSYLRIKDRLSVVTQYLPPSPWVELVDDALDKLKRNLRTSRNNRI